MKKTLILLLTIMAIALSSCKNEAESAEKIGDFNVELLFEKDSCKVFRFRDGGRYVYWSECSGRMEESHSEGSGKHHRTVTTESITVSR